MFASPSSGSRFAFNNTELYQAGIFPSQTIPTKYIYVAIENISSVGPSSIMKDILKNNQVDRDFRRIK